VIYAQWTAWKEDSRAALKNFRQAGNAKIADFKKKFTETKLHAANTINQELESGLYNLASGIFERIKDGMKNAQELYAYFTGAFFKTERSKELVAINLFAKIGLQIDQAVRFGTKKSKLQKELLADLDNAVDAIDKNILDVYSYADKLFWELERK
jgi:hypothetical protein